MKTIRKNVEYKSTLFISLRLDTDDLTFLAFLDENKVMTGLPGKVRIWDIREENK